MGRIGTTRSWEWTPRKEQAACLVAEDLLTDDKIAKEVGLGSRHSLTNWKQAPEFKERVKMHIEEANERESSRAFAMLHRRLALAYSEIQKLEEAERETAKSFLAEIEEAAKTGKRIRAVPGGLTGKVRRSYKQIGNKVMPEYTIDAGPSMAMQSWLKYIAQELGQLVEKHEVIKRDYTRQALKKLSDDELEVYEALAAKVAGETKD